MYKYFYIGLSFPWKYRLLRLFAFLKVFLAFSQHHLPLTPYLLAVTAVTRKRWMTLPRCIFWNLNSCDRNCAGFNKTLYCEREGRIYRIFVIFFILRVVIEKRQKRPTLLWPDNCGVTCRNGCCKIGIVVGRSIKVRKLTLYYC